MSRWKLFGAGLLCFALTFSAFADRTRGNIAGTVTDGSNDALPGVTVTITNDGTGLVRSTVTNASGEYRFSAVPIGDYTITATMPGFQTFKRTIRVTVGQTASVPIALQPGAVSEVMQVTSTVDLVDTSTTTSGLTINTDELVSKVPIARNTTATALLAPASTEGDTAFDDGGQGLASIGGSSVAENAYNVNGTNITNFRNGLGSNQVPFEFIKEVQVKTGGYEAQYGRSTGGVINTVTKSGSNEFHAGINLFFEPDSLRGESPDGRGATPRFFSQEEREETEGNIWVSGPIVKDRVFFYALYNSRDMEYQEIDNTDTITFTNDSPFWGAKLDWNITPNHIIELTAFNDDRDGPKFGIRDSGNGTTVPLDGNDFRGGETLIAKYTGIFGSNLVVSLQGSTNEFDRSTVSALDVNPAILDSRDAAAGNVSLGSWFELVPSNGTVDERDAFRLDIDYYLGNHSFRFGMDREDNTSSDSSFYSGGIYYRYFQNNGRYSNLESDFGTSEYVRVRRFINDGSFDVISQAFYLQDAWQVSDRLLLNLGVRLEQYDNKNALGESFIKEDSQYAPRLGAVYDPKGDGTSKVYFNFGRYHLPIASNTNVRLAGAEFFTQDFFPLYGLNGDDTPIFNESELLEANVFADGDTPDPRTVRSNNIEPMYQDEWAIGYETRIGDNWSVGARFSYRELGQVIEDLTIDAALVNFFNADPDVYTPNHTYVLANPGEDINILVNFEVSDPDNPNGYRVGEETVTITADQLAYPDPERQYYGLELTFNRRFADNWMLQGSYTWSHSYGNYEGWVRSDNGQDDAGITNLYDHPELTDGAYGNLPNDRRHNVKLFGGYVFDNGLGFGANLTARSGRPINSFGVATGTPAATYGASSFYFTPDGGSLQLAPRGSGGTTDTITRLDLSGKYDLELGRTTLTFAVDVFNAFDSDEAVEVFELRENDGGADYAQYGNPTFYQRPRAVRFSIGAKF
jgi:outer membrane receptor protein involved in Fe transport